MKKQWIKKMKNSEGFIAIESLQVIFLIILTLILVIGFYLYLTMKQTYTQDVNLLADEVAAHGGLTAEDLSNFKTRLGDKGIQNPNVSVSIMSVDGKTVADSSNLEKGIVVASNVTNNTYVTRDDDVLLQVVVTMPADNSIVNSANRMLGADEELNGQYVWKRVVKSKKE